MGRKTWDSIPAKYKLLSCRINVVLTRSSGGFDIGNTENVVTCRSKDSALELLAGPPYSLSIGKVFVIGGGEVLSESLNGLRCEAIHLTEIDTRTECYTFIPAVDSSACLSLSQSVLSQSLL